MRNVTDRISVGPELDGVVSKFHERLLQACSLGRELVQGNPLPERDGADRWGVHASDGQFVWRTLATSAPAASRCDISS